MTVRWALVGPGRHATRNVLPQFKTATGAELAAVVSRDRARADELARTHGIPKAFTTLDEALADPAIDAIYDATPDGLHAGHIAAAARAGKHALIEKPLAISVKEAEQAIDAAKRAGVTLGVVFQARHDAAHREARRMVQAGEIGEVVMAHVFLPMPRPVGAAPPAGGNWRADPKMRPGGIASSIGDHAHDTLAFLVGQNVVEVAAVTDATQAAPPNERVASILLKLSGGAFGYAAASFKTPFGRRPLEIHGATGSLLLSNSYGNLVGADGEPTIEIVNAAGRRTWAFAPTECFRLEIESFSRAVEGKGQPTTTAAEGLRAIAITEAIYESARTGRAVKIE